MTILAVDASSRTRVTWAVATREGAVVAGGMLHGRAAGEALPGAIAGLDLSRLDAVVVATGPGSYTGLRVGMATGLGVAHAAGLPLHGVGALAVVAHAAPDAATDICAVAPAGRGGVYTARYSRRDGALVETEPPRRAGERELAAPEGVAVVSFDPLPGGDGRALPDPVAALARAAAWAVARPPLDLAGASPTLDGAPPP